MIMITIFSQHKILQTFPKLGTISQTNTLVVTKRLQHFTILIRRENFSAKLKLIGVGISSFFLGAIWPRPSILFEQRLKQTPVIKKSWIRAPIGGVASLPHADTSNKLVKGCLRTWVLSAIYQFLCAEVKMISNRPILICRQVQNISESGDNSLHFF